MNKEIESTLELPYKLIDIGMEDERFVLSFKRRFDEHQDYCSIKRAAFLRTKKIYVEVE